MEASVDGNYQSKVSISVWEFPKKMQTCFDHFKLKEEGVFLLECKHHDSMIASLIFTHITSMKRVKQ